MQDRYAGDIGDFVKLGLIRHLADPVSNGGMGSTVGLNWYLAPDEAHGSSRAPGRSRRPTTPGRCLRPR
jgi:hypothetical protein